MNIRVIGNEGFFNKYIKENIITFLMALIAFLLGIIIGTLYFKNFADNSISGYVEKSIIKLTDEKIIDNYDILRKGVIKNIGIGLAFWILGASVIGIPVLVIYIGYRGFTIGFTISTFIATFGFLKGNLMSIIMLFFQNIVLVFAMGISLISGVKLAYNILVKRKEMKYELIRHTVICSFCMLFFIISVGIEMMLNGPILSYFLSSIK